MRHISSEATTLPESKMPVDKAAHTTRHLFAVSKGFRDLPFEYSLHAKERRDNFVD